MGAFDDTYTQAGSEAGRNLIDRPPAGFAESFRIEHGLVTREGLSTSALMSMDQQRARRNEEIRRLAGEDAFIRALTVPTEPATTRMISDLAKRYPEIKTDEQLFEEVKEENRRYREESAIATRHQTWGGKVGSFVGAMAASIQDPFILGSMFTGGSAAGQILKRAAQEAGINLASEAAVQTALIPYKRRLESEYTPGQVALQLAASATLGGLFGAGAAGLERIAARRVPTQIERDAASVLDDMGDVLRDSPLRPRPDLDDAHIKATAKAIDDIDRGQPVDVDQQIIRAINEGDEGRVDVADIERQALSGLTVNYVDEPIRTGDIEAAGLYRRGENAITVKRHPDPERQMFLQHHEEGHFLYDHLQNITVADIMSRDSQLWNEAIKTSAVKSHWKGEKTPFGVDWVEALADLRAEWKARPERIGPNLEKFLVENMGGARLSQSLDSQLAAAIKAGDDAKIKALLLEKQGQKVAGDIAAERVRLAERDAREQAFAALREDVTPGPRQARELERVREYGPTEEQRLTGFIQRHGGINLDEAGALRGDFEALGEAAGAKSRRLLRNGKESPAKLAEYAHEAGFIDEPDPALLKEALERDLTGDAVYSKQSTRFEHNLDKQLKKEADDYFEAEAEKAVAELEARVKTVLEENPDIVATLKKMELGEPVTIQGKARDILDTIDNHIKEIDAIKTCLAGPAIKPKVKKGGK